MPHTELTELTESFTERKGHTEPTVTQREAEKKRWNHS